MSLFAAPGRAARTSEWGTELLDLDAYVTRLRDRGPLDASAPTLRRLHRAHVMAIPFENIDAALGRGIQLDQTSIQAKLLHRRRGGYCHEHNLLFGCVLERLGFCVTRLLTRVCQADGTVLPRGHASLLVEADGCVWLADVGFGGGGPLEPIPLVPDVTVRQAGWLYRVVEDAGCWTLEIGGRGGWRGLYAFSRLEFRQADFAMANYFTSTHLSSPFATQVLAYRTGADGARYGLNGLELTVQRPGDGIVRRSLHVEQVPQVLERVFGVQLPAADRLKVCDLLRAGRRVEDTFAP
ncbi:arylamine N-acetyltransferase family protein [Luedemannella helvata]|uniref:Arylamine N-acetyltransferase n=1 Tax=Luedemannella helvata TaxID=349315 RepID=A0ABN2JTD6_9ACTN